MKKELLQEINRFREIIGLGLLNEAPLGSGPIFKAIERFFDKFGVKTLEESELKSLESALAKDANLVRDFDEIGQKLSNAATSAEGERLLDVYLRQLPNFKLVVNALEKGAPNVFSDIVDKTFKAKMNPQFYDVFEQAYEKQGTKGVLDLYDVAVPSNQSERMKFMLSKWKPEPSVGGRGRQGSGAGQSGTGQQGGGAGQGGGTGSGRGGSTTPISKEAKILFDLEESVKTLLDDSEIKFINEISPKILDDGIKSLTKAQRIEAEATLNKVRKSLDDAIEKFKQDTQKMTGEQKIIAEKRIAWWENFKKQAVSFVGPKAVWTYVKIGAGLFLGYIGFGWFMGLCDFPLISLLCSSAKKNLKNFKPEEEPKEKPEEGGEEDGEGSLTSDDY